MTVDRFNALISAAKIVCSERTIQWEFRLDARGRAPRGYEWNLTLLAGLSPPPQFYLGDFAIIPGIAESAQRRNPKLCRGRPDTVISPEWQDLIKANVIDGLFHRKNQPSSVYAATYRPLLALASVCGDTPPWKITREHVELAEEAARDIQPSGKLSIDIGGIVTRVFDNEGLSEFCPVSSMRGRGRTRTGKASNRTKEIKKSLSERSEAHKLPSEEAFWEIVRIAFTEQPVSFLDKLRFAAVKSLVFTGLRVNEVFYVHHEWAAWRDYVDVHGRPAGDSGGISRSLMLKYFGEKQRVTGGNKVAMFEAVQHIPELFAQPLSESLDEIVQITTPLRNRLRLQVETNRIFPEFDRQHFIPLIDAYVRLTGDPFPFVDPKRQELIENYKSKFSVECLDEIEKRQTELKGMGASLAPKVRVYFAGKLGNKLGGPPARDLSGSLMKRIEYSSAYFRVGELEEFLLRAVPTKISDLMPLPLASGINLPPYELLFVMPKRALSEERNDGICDVRRYAFVGRMIGADLDHTLSGVRTSNSTLFEKYGKDSEARALTMTTHMFRHLQNTELFRLGVADTVITKRFNRTSLAQSHDYDHRSLAEELSDMSIPSDVHELFNEKSINALKLITLGKAAGPIVDEFRAIQKAEGDEAAYVYLATEADGFHTTPYGHCLNSFTVEPCPKSLECYAGCRHLTATGMPEHTKNLIALRDRYNKLIASITDHPAPAIGKESMLKHAVSRLNGIEAALRTAPGGNVFPDGADMFISIERPFKGPFSDA